MTLEHIIIGQNAKEKLSYVKQAEVIESKGIKGDRYYYKKGTFNISQVNQNVREISIISYEGLEICNKRIDTKLDFLDLRRNLVIKKFNYEELKDKEFKIGSATFKIVRTCPPCKFLSRLLANDMMTALKYIGGYRATIIKSGIISIGDKLSI
ncbi:MAG TPA: MOSC domain-containing protein [Arcobacter sp.]|nr:MOSC domain-containing protein [Arcobacter sp.]HIP56174.1 MOSC domain-containing protein [Arcobacter sp.]